MILQIQLLNEKVKIKKIGKVGNFLETNEHFHSEILQSFLSSTEITTSNPSRNKSDYFLKFLQKSVQK